LKLVVAGTPSSQAKRLGGGTQVGSRVKKFKSQDKLGFAQALNTSLKVGELSTCAVFAYNSAFIWQSKDVSASKFCILV
jgi:hypothetical protein